MDNNSTYEQYEQEIDLKDLMFAVLHKWRPVILVAVVLALVLGGAKGAMTYRQQNDPEVSKETREKYQEELDLYEKNKETAEREIENLKTDIANQQEYLDKSIWINMSPYVESAIEAIQQGTDKSATTVEDAVAAIEEVTGMAQDSGRSLEEISALAEDSSSRAAAIATAATEQSAAAEEINRHISDVNVLSATMAEAMKKAALEVREMTDQAHVLKELLNEIRVEETETTAALQSEDGPRELKASPAPAV